MIESISAYYQTRQVDFRINDQVIKVFTKPGLAGWDESIPMSKLLAEYATINPGASVLLFGSPIGALAVYLASIIRTGRLSIIETSHTAIEMTQLTLAANPPPNQIDIDFITDIEYLPEQNKTYDIALLQIPKGRALTRRWLIQAYLALRDRATLFIAGANKAGIQSVIKDASELFWNPRILGYSKGNRVVSLEKVGGKPLPPWTQDRGIASNTWVEFEIKANTHTLDICSLPGVFSYNHLDGGTEMFLDILQIIPGQTVLDVGCGYGVIGAIAAKQGAGWVDLVDDNLLAVASSRKTLAINHISNAAVFAGDLLQPVENHKYDLILTNPPFHAGHAVNLLTVEALIRQAHQALNPGGQLILVANRFLPYDRLVQVVFGNATLLSKSNKFHVISGINTPNEKINQEGK